MNHLYLKKINADKTYTAGMDKKETEQDRRHIIWKYQRAIYGFDDRETWGWTVVFMPGFMSIYRCI